MRISPKTIVELILLAVLAAVFVAVCGWHLRVDREYIALQLMLDNQARCMALGEEVAELRRQVPVSEVALTLRQTSNRRLAQQMLITNTTRVLEDWVRPVQHPTLRPWKRREQLYEARVAVDRLCNHADGSGPRRTAWEFWTQLIDYNGYFEVESGPLLRSGSEPTPMTERLLRHYRADLQKVSLIAALRIRQDAHQRRGEPAARFVPEDVPLRPLPEDAPRWQRPVRQP